MHQFSVPFVLALATSLAIASPSAIRADGPYHIVNSVRAGGEGGFDYVYADSAGRKLYVARGGSNGRVSVYNLGKLDLAGEISKTSGHGAAVDAKTHHGFASSKPVAMWDSKTLAPIKTIDVDGGPDGILNDDYNHRTYIFSHSAPNVTVIDAAEGKVLGTIDLGGAPEQAASDGKGKIYVDIEDKGTVAVIDAATMKVVNTLSLEGRGGGNAGLALDAKNGVLFVACREPQAMVIVNAKDGKFLASIPIGQGCDGAVFNPRTGECFSSQRDGTLTVIKEQNPTSFVLEQTVKTMQGAKTLTLDKKTNQILLIAAEYGAPAPGSRRGTLVPGSFTILVVGK